MVERLCPYAYTLGLFCKKSRRGRVCDSGGYLDFSQNPHKHFYCSTVGIGAETEEELGTALELVEDVGMEKVLETVKRLRTTNIPRIKQEIYI